MSSLNITGGQVLRDGKLAVGNLAIADGVVVAGAAALPNVAVPGPLTLLHAVASPEPDGSPSSLAVPARTAAVPVVAAGAIPGLTCGAAFGAGMPLTLSKTAVL